MAGTALDGRKVRIVRWTGQALVDLFKAGEHHLVTVGQALPDDATFLRAGYDQYGDILMVVHSETFTPVNLPAERIPELPAVLFRHA